MKASEAKRISDRNTNTYDSWLEGALSMISKNSNKGRYDVYIYVGNGSFLNKNFAEEINEKESLLRKLGYKTSTHRETSWGSVFNKTFDYYLEVRWG